MGLLINFYIIKSKLSMYKIKVNYIIKEKIMSKVKKCGCGRSPSGNCIGWHALSEEEYQTKKAEYEAKKTG